MYVSSGSAAFNDCSFAECHAIDVRLHSHTTPQAPTPQREATQIPLLRDYGASAHVQQLHHGEGLIARSRVACELTCEDAGARRLRLGLGWCTVLCVAIAFGRASRLA